MPRTKNWNHLHPKYAGLWVAFADNEETVIAADKNLKTTIKRAKEKGFNLPPVFKVPREMLPSHLHHDQSPFTDPSFRSCSSTDQDTPSRQRHRDPGQQRILQQIHRHS